VGGGVIETRGSTLCLIIAHARADRYADAQIDDYRGLPRRRFPWRPALRLTVRARFSPQVRGTAGFGFWNDPFLMTGRRTPTLPRAVWFFYASPPSNIKLDRHTAGHGWKAAVIDTLRPIALPLAFLALPATLLMNWPPLYRILWPPIQHALHIGEREVPADMETWHTYSLEWRKRETRFFVDGECFLHAPAPRGPLGFVLWIDNQYLVITPWGRFRWGLLAVPDHQWMEVGYLTIERL